MKFFLQKENSIFNFWEEIYIFGSILTSLQPNDIDILLVYKYENLPQTKIEIEKLRNILSDKFDILDLDFLVLSDLELEQTQFLNKVHYEKIK